MTTTGVFVNRIKRHWTTVLRMNEREMRTGKMGNLTKVGCRVVLTAASCTTSQKDTCFRLAILEYKEAINNIEAYHPGKIRPSFNLNDACYPRGLTSHILICLDFSLGRFCGLTLQDRHDSATPRKVRKGARREPVRA